MFNKLGGAADGLNARLGKLGITSQDLSVILGAGLAGGAGFAIREVLRFVGASIEAASALREQEAASLAVFDASSKLVEGFAEQAAAIGLSERAALKATTTFGGFFQNVGLADEAAAKLAIGFTALAADTASLFDIDTETAAERIISGLRGEQDAVERLNVSLNEKAVADRAMADSGKKSADEITNGERVMARAKIIAEQLTVAYGNFALTADGLANSQRRANAEWENAKAALGDALQPAAIAVTNALTDQLNALRALDDGLQGTTESVTLMGIGFRKLIDGKETNALQKLRDIFLGFDGDAGDAADTTDEIAGALDELEDPANQAAVAMDKAADSMDKFADAQVKLERALADSERRVDKAETTLARAFEDAELRVDKAERGLAEAFEDRSERIADSEAKLVEERLQGFRSVRAAREKLADFERDSERSVADAERNILDLRRAQSKAILSSLLDVEQAQIDGDALAFNRAQRELAEARDGRSIAQAEKDLALDKADRERELARLQRDLAEERIDAAKDIADAQIDLAQVIEDAAERIADAQRDIRDAYRDSARSIADAQRGLTDAMREGSEAVADAREDFDELAASVKAARKEVDKLNKSVERLNLLTDAGNANQPGIADPFAAGGMAPGGEVALVGERGPELIIPNSNSTVVSNDQLVSMLRQMVSNGGSSGATQNITINEVSGSARATWRKIEPFLVQGVNV